MTVRRNKVPVGSEVLEQLITAENSCVEVVTVERNLVAEAYHGTNYKSAIKEELNDLIGDYDRHLNGIVLGYKNIKLLSLISHIDQFACLHFPIRADFYVFKPVVGKVLPAVVIKKSKDHVGCLAYHTFNVSIPKPEGAIHWEGDQVEIGQEVSFRVTFFNLDAKIPYIRGEFLKTTTVNKKIKFDDSVDESLDLKVENEEGTIRESHEISKKRKKSQKSLENGVADSVDISEQEVPHAVKEEIEDDEPVKKKRKKSRHSLENEITEEVDSIPSNEDSIKTKKKKSRKSLENDETSEVNSTTQHDESIKTEKKKSRKSLENDQTKEVNSTTLHDESIKTEKKKSRKSLENDDTAEAYSTTLNDELIRTKKRSRRSYENEVVADTKEDEPKPKKRRKSMAV